MEDEKTSDINVESAAAAAGNENGDVTKTETEKSGNEVNFLQGILKVYIFLDDFFLVIFVNI